MSLFLEILVSLLVLGGALFLFGAAVGIIRFPDTYCRMHALGKGSTMGVICLALASLVYFMWAGAGICTQSLLALLFIAISSPVGAHMISKASYHYGIPLWEKSVRDDLLEDCKFISEDDVDY